MAILVFGISHHTAPIGVRERVALDAAQLPAALAGALAAQGTREAVILSTCNRTEFYLAGEEVSPAPLSEWLARVKALDPATLSGHFYTLENQLAVRHALRVACGLDSMVLGEPQILGQLKQAYEASVNGKAVGKTLGKLMQYAFTVAKKVRTETAIGRTPVSVAYAAVRLARQIHGDLAGRTALLIGAGDTIGLVAAHLRRAGIGRLVIANRTLARSAALAREMDATAVALTDLAEHLPGADIIVSSTASRVPLITRALVQSAVKTRRYQPMFIVDLAVPRDVEPSVATLADVYLYTVDDLNNVITENRELRLTAAAQAEEIVNLHVQNFLDWLQSLNGNAVIVDFRRQAEAVRDELLEKAQRRLATGSAPAEVLRGLAVGLTNRLLHYPTSTIRAASIAGRQDVVSFARELLGLDAPEDDHQS